MFSIEEAITALEHSFDVYGSSPYFFIDWRWYKDIHGDNRKFNEIGKDCYRKNLHNLLDYRYVFGPRDFEENTRILNYCLEVWHLIASYGYQKDKKHIDGICQKICDLEAVVRTFSPLTADALLDFYRTLAQYPDITAQTDWGSFASWWGRGMQYLSFIRNRYAEPE